MRFHPAPLALLITLVTAVSCRTPPPATVAPASPPVPAPVTGLAELPPAPSLSRTALQYGGGNAIYLARQEVRDGFRHQVVLEVWRHDEALGPAPAPGDDVSTPMQASAGKTGEEDVLVVLRASGVGVESFTGPVAFLRTQNGNRSLAQLKELLLSIPPERRVWPVYAVGRVECLTHARAVYLVNAEPETGSFVIAEVWRHDPRLGAAPAPGAPLPYPPHGPHAVYRNGGSAVAIVLDDSHADLAETGRQSILLRIFRDRIVDLGVSVAALRTCYVEAGGAPEVADGFAHLVLSPSVFERLDQAEAIYLADVIRDGPQATLRMAEVLRHNPRLGPAPQVGMDLPRARSNDGIARSANVDRVLLLLRPGATPADLTNSEMASVINGYVPIYRLSLDRVRERVGLPRAR